VVVGVLVSAAHAQPVEHRLQVVSMWDSAFMAFAKRGELGDGATGPGLEALVASLDEGKMSSGTLLGDRTLRWAGERVARAYGAERVRAEIVPGGSTPTLWDEARWGGTPGRRTVWVVDPSGRGWPQELYHVVLKSSGPARHFIPYTSTDGRRLGALRFPLEFLWFYEERGTLWDKYVARNLDLTGGIGAVVGVNSNRTFPDQARIVVEQADQPTVYRAVLVWREPSTNREAPGSSNVIVH
jgi:hypothetical protein